MGNTWIVDMTHFDYKDDEAFRILPSTLKLWGYFGSIIAGTVNRPLPQTLYVGIQCRRRPRKRRCIGAIMSELHPDGNELSWHCPICGDNGTISNWKSTRWDPTPKVREGASFPYLSLIRTETPQAVHPDFSKLIQGTIEWNETGDPEEGLPKIVTDSKTYTWKELGEELMTLEGFNISIKIDG